MEIKDKAGNLLVIFFVRSKWKKGLNFLTQDSDYLQCGTWWYQKGHVLQKHKHKIFKRESFRTQELIYVVEGTMKAIVYDDEMNFVESIILRDGDLAIFLNGGHEYLILSDDTKILEVKNGPFVGVENDKIKF